MEKKINEVTWMVNVYPKTIKVREDVQYKIIDRDGEPRATYMVQEVYCDNSVEGLKKIFQELDHKVFFLKPEGRENWTCQIQVNTEEFYRLLNTASSTALVLYNKEGEFKCCKQHIGVYRVRITEGLQPVVTLEADPQPIEESFNIGGCFEL